MRFVSYADGRPAVVFGKELLDISAATRLVPGIGPVPDSVRGIICKPDCLAEVKRAVSWIEANKEVQDELRVQGALTAMSSDDLGAPLPDPGIIIAAGMNYRDHLEEMGAEPPEHPYTFTKARSSLTGTGPILLPTDHDQMVDWEAELAVVIGRTCHRVSPQEVENYIFGYMCANDVSARDWVDVALGTPGTMKPVTNWSLNLLGKQYPTFCPIGPALVTADEIDRPAALDISCRVNGVVMQKSNTADMVFSTAELISFVSQWYCLEPADIILTGTMAGVGVGRNPRIFLRDGDTVEVEIERIGTLRNIIARGEA